MAKRTWSRFARVSAFSHSEEHLKEKTVHGGIVTLIGVITALFLFISEFQRCMTVRVEQEMDVDKLRQEQIQVSFDVTFPALPCQAINIDLADRSGRLQTEGQVKVAHNGEVHKYQLDMHGRKLHKKEFISKRDPMLDNPFIIVLDDTDMASVREAVRHHEGCNIYGWFQVERMAGNIHFGVRPAAMIAMQEAGDIQSALLARHEQLHGDTNHPDAGSLNASHIISALRFGPNYPGQIQPLEGTSRIDRKATGVDKYFIKIVPTEWRGVWGRRVQTNQYSVTEYYTKLPPHSQEMPGFYILYDTWPIAVKLKQRRLGLLHLLVRTCAVCGGVWAVTRLVDGLVHKIVKQIRKLAQLGGAAP